VRESGPDERKPKDRGDPRRRCGWIQPSRRGGRGSHARPIAALRSDLIDPFTAIHKGRVVKRTGNGFISEFRSVVDAVRCAVEVQHGMIERNVGLPPERRIDSDE
jgi:hypothetical protein